MRTIASACRLVAGIVLAAALAAPVLADELTVTQDGASIHLDALGHRFQVPLPDWLTAAERLSTDVVGLVERNTYADAGQAFVEFFPRGQSYDKWTTTYAARVTLDAKRSLADYRDASIMGYSKTCNPALAGSFTLGKEEGDFFPALIFVCGAYQDAIATLRGQGEVMLSVFRKTPTGVAVVYQEWRGAAFDPSSPDTWPVSRQV
ncbi:MAG: hypothetical protein EOP19_09540, partial [Hyphomicrobiales bacterium]